MNVEAMRAALKDLYRGVGWVKKVNRMPDAQVIAIYFRKYTEGKIR